MINTKYSTLLVDQENEVNAAYEKWSWLCVSICKTQTVEMHLNKTKNLCRLQSNMVSMFTELQPAENICLR